MVLSEITPHLRYVAYAEYKPYLEDGVKYGNDSRLISCEMGKLTTEIDGNTMLINPGEALYVPSGYPYKLYVKGKTTAHFLNFDFINTSDKDLPPSKPKEFTKTKDCDFIAVPKLSDTNAFDTPFIVRCTEDMRREIAFLEREFTERKIFYRESCTASMKLLLMLLARAREITHTTSVGERISEEVIKYVGENLGNCELNNTKVAEALNYHPYYIGSLVKKFTGVPLHKYILSRRISLSCEMLLTGELTVGQIAEKVGFKSAAHFSEAFKKATGVSPAVYSGRNKIKL